MDEAWGLYSGMQRNIQYSSVAFELMEVRGSCQVVEGRDSPLPLLYTFINVELSPTSEKSCLVKRPQLTGNTRQGSASSPSVWVPWESAESRKVTSGRAIKPLTQQKAKSLSPHPPWGASQVHSEVCFRSRLYQEGSVPGKGCVGRGEETHSWWMRNGVCTFICKVHWGSMPSPAQGRDLWRGGGGSRGKLIWRSSSIPATLERDGQQGTPPGRGCVSWATNLPASPRF